jgi:hypothetical protein
MALMSLAGGDGSLKCVEGWVLWEETGVIWRQWHSWLLVEGEVYDPFKPDAAQHHPRECITVEGMTTAAAGKPASDKADPQVVGFNSWDEVEVPGLTPIRKAQPITSEPVINKQSIPHPDTTKTNAPSEPTTWTAKQRLSASVMGLFSGFAHRSSKKSIKKNIDWYQGLSPDQRAGMLFYLWLIRGQNLADLAGHSSVCIPIFYYAKGAEVMLLEMAEAYKKLDAKSLFNAANHHFYTNLVVSYPDEGYGSLIREMWGVLFKN